MKSKSSRFWYKVGRFFNNVAVALVTVGALVLFILVPVFFMFLLALILAFPLTWLAGLAGLQFGYWVVVFCLTVIMVVGRMFGAGK